MRFVVLIPTRFVINAAFNPHQLRLEYLYYLNYLFKYYELLDTLFLAVKGKPTPFLHVYHHASVMALCFFELEGHAAVQWVPITINLLVHVVMYYYYACASIGIKIWWKKYLTTLQITQFVIDLVAIFYASYRMIASYVPCLFSKTSTDRRKRSLVRSDPRWASQRLMGKCAMERLRL